MTASVASRATTAGPRGTPGGNCRRRCPCWRGADRLSKRQVRAAMSEMSDLLGLSISVGMIAKAERRAAATVAETVEEARRATREAPALCANETG